MSVPLFVNTIFNFRQISILEIFPYSYLLFVLFNKKGNVDLLFSYFAIVVEKINLGFCVKKEISYGKFRCCSLIRNNTHLNCKFPPSTPHPPLFIHHLTPSSPPPLLFARPPPTPPAPPSLWLFCQNHFVTGLKIVNGSILSQSL